MEENQINIDQLVETGLVPIANSMRLKILLSIYEGKKSFTKLTQITNLRGRHLIFHLKKLLDAGLIGQEENKGDYLITQKGIQTLTKILTFPTLAYENP